MSRNLTLAYSIELVRKQRSTGVSVTENVAMNAAGATGVYNAGTLSVTNTTISGNVGGWAGFLNATGASTFLNATFSGNSGGAVVAFESSIIANSVSQPNCVIQAGSASLITSTGFNLSDVAVAELPCTAVAELPCTNGVTFFAGATTHPCSARRIRVAPSRSSTQRKPYSITRVGLAWELRRPTDEPRPWGPEKDE